MKYISTELIDAKKSPLDGKSGYIIKYDNGHVSWCPEAVFDKSYLAVDENPNLPSGVSISPHMVDKFIAETHVSKVGEKTTLVRCVLVNGFEIVQSSACVDPKNYNEQIGAQVCLKKIKDEIWGLLGFLLQTAHAGVNVR